MFDAIVTTWPLLVALRNLSARNSYRQISWYSLGLKDRMKERLLSKKGPLNEGNIGNKTLQANQGGKQTAWLRR
jgi:hypothetical protein